MSSNFCGYDVSSPTYGVGGGGHTPWWKALLALLILLCYMAAFFAVLWGIKYLWNVYIDSYYMRIPKNLRDLIEVFSVSFGLVGFLFFIAWASKRKR